MGFSTNVGEARWYPMAGGVDINLNFTPYAKFNSKWITDLNVNCKARQHLGEKNTGENLQDLDLGKEF